MTDDDKRIGAFFGPKGKLVSSLAAYEHREGQIVMAREVDGAIHAKHHLIVEAGTGTGKSLAYLIPAVLSGKKTVVSTLTKNLQEQLLEKDIPFLHEKLGLNFSACTLKGRSNYLCLRRFGKFTQQPYFEFQDEAKLFRKLEQWVAETQTGDRAEIDFLPETFSVWSEISSTTDSCIGKRCRQRDECFFEHARLQAYESDVIIVNHHLLFADVAIKKKTKYAGVLPVFEVLVLDEAHEIEDVATNYFGLRFSSWQTRRLALETNRELDNVQEQTPDELPMNLKAAEEAATFFFNLFRRSDREKTRLFSSGWRTEHDLAYNDFVKYVKRILENLKKIKVDNEEVKSLANRWGKLRAEADLICALDKNDWVYWVEQTTRTITLAAARIDLADELRAELFERVPVVIMTSATLTTNGTFDFFKKRVGIGQCVEAIVESPFDFKKQALLYVPTEAPDPRSESFDGFVVETVRRILLLSKGKAFVLFTSHRRMRQTHAALAPVLPMTTLLQGEAPKKLLIKQFTEDMDAVLFATNSFWHGVDVVGPSLSVVIIDKIPFSVPDEPLVQARIDYIKEQGGNSFYEYMVPNAIISLKQGFGRLIRSRSDIGLLVLLDPRFIRSSYATIFQKSMPPVTMTTNFASVESITRLIR